MTDLVIYRDWVNAVAAERMATAQSSEAEPYTTHGSKSNDGFTHVVGAARRKAAAAGEERREHDLVDSNGRKHDAPVDSNGAAITCGVG